VAQDEKDLEQELAALEQEQKALDAVAAQRTSQENINTRLVDALERISSDGRIRQSPPHLYKGATPWNAQGRKRKTKLSRPFYQNGRLVKDAFLSDAEITEINKLQAGTYHGGKWLIIEANEGEQGTSLDFRYANKSQEQRMDFNAATPGGLIDALKQMNREASRPS
jgi:hypothetical protein